MISLIFILLSKIIKAHVGNCIHNKISGKFPLLNLETDLFNKFFNLATAEGNNGYDEATALPIRIHIDTTFLS